jgi:hypothetical protein
MTAREKLAIKNDPFQMIESSAGKSLTKTNQYKTRETTHD